MGRSVIWKTSGRRSGVFAQLARRTGGKKQRRRESETERVAVLNWDKDKTNSVNSSPRSFLTLHNVPALPSQMLPGIKQEVYHG